MRTPNNTVFNDNVQAEQDPNVPEKLSLWITRDQGKMERVLVPAQNEVTNADAFQWSEANTVQYQIFQRKKGIFAFMQKAPENLVEGPNKTELTEIEGSRKTAFVVINQKGESLDGLSAVTGQEVPDAEKIANNIFIIRGVKLVRDRTREQIAQIDIPLEGELLSPAAVRQRYDAGYERITQYVPSNIRRDQDPDMALLSDLKSFRKDAVRWAEMDGEAIRASEGGQMGMAWLIAIPSDHRVMNEQSELLSVPLHHAIHQLRIRPEDITEEWAGIGLLHELSHLRDFVLKIEPNNPNREQYISGEDRAYSAEICGADLLSEYRAAPAALRLFEELGIHTLEDFALNVQKYLPTIHVELDPYITTEKPKSEKEVGIRAAFWMFYSAKQFLKKTVQDPKEQSHLFRGFIEAVYEARGHLPKA